MRVLLLGGTAEAGRIAAALAAAGIPAVYSYAGRTAAPKPQPLPTRVGGFGGADGLADFLAAGGFSHLVDATHPFAAAISRNAVAAAGRAGVDLVAYERPAWTAGPGDDWTVVPDLDGAAAALPEGGTVFLAIGRQGLDAFAGLSGRRWLLRLVDPVERSPLPDAAVVVDRGPFTVEGDRALMRAHGVTLVVAKNAGGAAAEAKLIAARDLGIPVVMVERPVLPARTVVATVGDLLARLGHPLAPGDTERGV